MFSGSLADLFVTFSAKGAEALKATIGSLKTELNKVQTGIDNLGRKAGIAFATLSGTVGGLVTAGAAGSAQMNYFTAQMERLSRGVASIFVPEMEKVIGLVQRAANWFQSLTGAPQRNIAQWIEGAAVALGVAMVLPKVAAGFTSVAVSIGEAAAALAAGE